MNIINVFTNPKEVKYSIKKEYHKGIFASQISNNEQYLAYGGKQERLIIYDINLDEIIRNIKLNHKILAIQFTHDSSQLYVGCERGYLFGYDVLNNFSIILKQKQKFHIQKIITIKNQYLITLSSQGIVVKVTKIDIKRKKQIFNSKSHQLFKILILLTKIVTIDYNQINDIIMFGYEKQIHLWDCKNRRSFIQKKRYSQKYSHNSEISQLQFINNNQYLLSLDVGCNLYKWKIDYIKKDIVKEQQYRVPCEIQSFYSVNNDQNLLMICDGYLKVINNQGETIYTLYHPSEEYNVFFDFRQIDNLRCINIRDRSIILQYISIHIFGYIIKMNILSVFYWLKSYQKL